jgi:hypothetical protein
MCSPYEKGSLHASHTTGLAKDHIDLAELYYFLFIYVFVIAGADYYFNFQIFCDNSIIYSYLNNKNVKLNVGNKQ